MSDLVEPQDSAAPDRLPPAVAAAGWFDEALTGPAEWRAAWQPLLTSLDRIGHEELAVRAENSRRLLAEHGVSCFVERKAGGADEPWQLDLWPLVIGSAEWRELEAGLIQRARLLNLILGDLYQTQRLVRDGLVPAQLVFANPGYLRACQGIEVKDGAYLQLYAADLGRSPDGRWWVLADRTQAPAGLGFALENRSVLSRVLPETVRDVQPRSLLDALHNRRDTLRRFAPRSTDNPVIVLLTPGPRNEAYFEHSYLARIFGLTLVEGDDLTVRDRRLFIKTLDGLRRADVVLRHVNDAFCDPLELRADSRLGVPGLVEVARARQVALGNALGAGLMESPAFMPFLGSLCRHLLDEELRLSSLATWWCGQAHEQAYVRERVDELVVRPALNPSGPGFTAAELSTTQRAGWLEQIRLRPHEFVGQESVRLSRAPVWAAARGREERPFVLRVFVLREGADFTVMPGGLARVLDDEGWGASPLKLNMLSKDVWVLPNGAGTGPRAAIVSSPPPALERAPSDLPSRTADNFFWLGRYTERLEQIARAARQALRCLDNHAPAAGPGRLAPLFHMLSRLGLVSPPPSLPEIRETLQMDILRLLFQEEHAGGARELLKQIHLASFSVRDRLSADTWRILNRLEPDARQRSGRLPLAQALGVLHTLVLDLAAFSGMETENMTRGHSWVFLDLGRRLERGMFIARLMEAVWRGGQALDLLLEPALEIADSVMTHRRRYFAEPRLATTMEVLALDAANPRSLAFQIDALKRHAAVLPANANPEGAAVVHSRVHQLETLLSAITESVVREDPAEVSRAAGLLAGLAAGLAEFSELVTQVYFSHVAPRAS